MNAATDRLRNADQRATQMSTDWTIWPWPEDGWNCAQRSEAIHSSCHESLFRRALTGYVQTAGQLSNP